MRKFRFLGVAVLVTTIGVFQATNAATGVGQEIHSRSTAGTWAAESLSGITTGSIPNDCGFSFYILPITVNRASFTISAKVRFRSHVDYSGAGIAILDPSSNNDLMPHLRLELSEREDNFGAGGWMEQKENYYPTAAWKKTGRDIQVGEWYRLKLRVDGTHVRGFLDDVELFTDDIAALAALPRDVRVAFYIIEADVEFADLRVDGASGTSTGSTGITDPANVSWNFERGDLTGWTATGDAFAFAPTYGDNSTARGRGQPSRHQGNFWIGGYEKRHRLEDPAGAIQGDGPQGTLTSAPFAINCRSISFLIGGGGDTSTERVELVVDGSAVLKTTGKYDESMERVTWNVAPYLGRAAQIRVVDNSSGGWGHINFDDVRFGDAVIKAITAGAAAPISAPVRTFQVPSVPTGSVVRPPSRASTAASSSTSSTAPSSAPSTASPAQAAAACQELLRLTNAQRTLAGLRPLRYEARLAASAERHSADMARNNFLGHKGSDATRGEQRISATGYAWKAWGENVSMGQGAFGEPASTVERWMTSPPHRKNILDPAFEEIGFGIADAADGSRYVTQVFSTPQ